MSELIIAGAGIDLPERDRNPVQFAAIRLEMEAVLLNAVAQSAHVEPSTWADAIDDHEYRREAFRAELQSALGIQISLIERALSL